MLIRCFLCNVNDTRARIGQIPNLWDSQVFTIAHIVIDLSLHIHSCIHLRYKSRLYIVGVRGCSVFDNIKVLRDWGEKPRENIIWTPALMVVFVSSCNYYCLTSKNPSLELCAVRTYPTHLSLCSLSCLKRIHCSWSVSQAYLKPVIGGKVVNVVKLHRILGSCVVRDITRGCSASPS